MPHSVIFLIALLVIMAALIVFTFVFVILIDRKLAREDHETEPRDLTDSEEGS